MNYKLLRNSSMLLVGVIGVAGIKPALAADSPPAEPAAKPAPAPKPTATPAVAEIPKKLSLLDLNKELKTLDEYAAILQKAGYTTKVNAEASGKQILVIDWKDKTGSYVVNLTQDKQGEIESLNFVAPLSSFAQQPRVPAEVFFKLVQAQDATRGAYFVFNSKLKRLFLCRTVPSNTITSRQLIDELENIQRAAQLTVRVWNPAMWITKPQPAATSSAPATPPAKK